MCSPPSLMPALPPSSCSGTSRCHRVQVCTPRNRFKDPKQTFWFAASRHAVETAVCAKPGSRLNKASDQSIFIFLRQVCCQHHQGHRSNLKYHTVHSVWNQLDKINSYSCPH